MKKSIKDLDISKIISNMVKKYRTDLNFTQEELAIKSKLSIKSIKQIESGKSDPPIFTLHKIATALKVKLYKLLEGI